MNLKSNNGSQLFPLGLLVIGMCCAVYCYNKPLGDFANYYFGSKLLLSGTNVWENIYNIAAFNKSIINQGYTGLFLSHTSVAPQSLLFYVPFALIPDPYLAKFVFNAVGMVSLSALFYFFQKRQSFSFGKSMVLVFIFLPALYYNILFGQTYILIAAILFFLLLYADEYPYMAALLLAVAISLKISPLILLFYFFIKRQYRFVIIALLFTAVIFLISIFIIGYETISNFYVHILPKLLNGFVNDPFSASYHSIIVMLRRLFLYDELLNPQVYKNLSIQTIAILSLMLTAILLFFVIQSIVAKQMNKAIAFFLLLLFVNASAGYTTTYGLMMLFPSLLLMEHTKSKVVLVIVILLCWLPPLLLVNQNPLFVYFKLYLFLAAIIILSVQYFNKSDYKIALFTTIVFIGVGVMKVASSKSKSFPYYNASTYQHDYILEAHVTGDTISYDYFDFKGFHQEKRAEEKLADRCEKEGSANVIRFLEDGTQVRKVVCFKDSVLFLSDYNRGPGLYNLYVLPKKQFEDLLK